MGAKEAPAEIRHLFQFMNLTQGIVSYVSGRELGEATHVARPLMQVLNGLAYNRLCMRLLMSTMLNITGGQDEPTMIYMALNMLSLHQPRGHLDPFICPDVLAQLNDKYN